MPVEAAAPQAEAPAGAEVALQEASEANGSSDAPGRSRPVYSPDEILEQLQSAPQPHCFNHQMLLKAHELQLQVVHGLKNAEARGPDAAHRILAAYVQSLYCTISALPGGLRYNQLEMSIIKSGLARPFINDIDVPTKRMKVGVPTTDALCDTLPEVLVVTAAAFLCYWHYLNFRHSPDTLPSDECALMLTTMVIKSLEREATRELVDQELSVMGGFDGFGASELRFLMHWVRSELMGYFAAVQYLLDDSRLEQSLVAQQHDRLHMVKVVPSNPLGYMLYTRSCLQFQQHRPAHVFATKGLQVAETQNEQICKPQLECIQAMGYFFGGAGPTYSPKALGQTLLDARGSLQGVTSWLPAPYHDLLTLDPEADAIRRWVLKLAATNQEEESEQETSQEETSGTAQSAGTETQPAWVVREDEQAAVDAASADSTACPTDAVYATPAPRELPVGALTQLQQQARVASAAALAAGKGSQGSGTGAVSKKGSKGRS